MKTVIYEIKFTMEVEMNTHSQKNVIMCGVGEHKA